MRYALVALMCGLSLASCGPASDSPRNADLPDQTVTPNEVEVPAPADTALPFPMPTPVPMPTPSDQAPFPEEQPAPEKLFNPGKIGPFAVRSYTEGLQNAAYKSAIVFYPDEKSSRRFPATTLSGGYTNTKEYMVWLGKHLASHGIITIVFTPTNTMSVDPSIWSRGHLGSLDQLELEDKRTGSPIAGRVNIDRLGVMGFSMGGAGTVLAVNKAGARVKAAVPLCPYQPPVLTAPVPMLSITGTLDTVAAPAYIERAYAASKSGQPKAFAKFNGMAHQDVVLGGSHHEEIARYATAWYRVFLAGEVAYKTYLNGAELEKHRTGTSVFAQSKDYMYQE